ncbi:phage protein [Pseudoscardovia radai]|uniref:Phage protein n=1 Tax=Pseudoscardovia radai TaxID=987066 RepID=A0A261EYI4_9BIFI|nr:hypothetical protein [Pseudoscardovia radai]OZG51726.1 phage protein [Pseudoscardovia radai]
MRGETVTIIRRSKAGEDPAGGTLWSTMEETVDDVLVADGSQSDSTEQTMPDGVTVARTAYMPRAWAWHSLKGCRMRLADGTEYEVVGDPHPYDGGLTPTRWHMVVQLTAMK